jgi:hypothetical protein
MDLDGFILENPTYKNMDVVVPPFFGKPPMRIESYGRIPVSFHPNYDLGGGFKHGWIIVHFIY